MDRLAIGLAHALLFAITIPSYIKEVGYYPTPQIASRQPRIIEVGWKVVSYASRHYLFCIHRATQFYLTSSVFNG